MRLGVSTEAALGKAQGQGRKPSQAVYDQADADGLVYSSRLTGRTCICVYDRALPSALRRIAGHRSRPLGRLPCERSTSP